MKTSIQQSVLMMIAAIALIALNSSCTMMKTAQDNDYEVGTTYCVNLSNDMLLVSDVYATYLDVKGEPVTEQINTTKWVMMTPEREVPLERGIACAFKVKPDSDIPNSKQGYHLKCEINVSGGENTDYSYTAIPIDTKGKKVMTKAEARQFIEENGKNVSYGFTIGLFPPDTTQFGIHWAPELAPEPRTLDTH